MKLNSYLKGLHYGKRYAKWSKKSKRNAGGFMRGFTRGASGKRQFTQGHVSRHWKKYAIGAGLVGVHVHGVKEGVEAGLSLSNYSEGRAKELKRMRKQIRG